MTRVTVPLDRVVFHVTPDGDDRWSGRLARANRRRTDGPLATLEGARDAVRRHKREHGVPAGGITVEIAAGVHERTAPFELGPEDSGAPYAPVVYRSARAHAARIIGGRRVSGFRPVSRPDILARLTPEARPHVRELDLKAAGIRDFGHMRPRGFGCPMRPAALELFFDGRPMTLARWPNVGFTTISGIPSAAAQDDGWGTRIAPPGAGFIYSGDRPRRWKSARDAWMHGYWVWDWANTYERIASYDAKSGHIRADRPRNAYGFKAGQRFFFLNVLEELDQPGEWYLDRPTGMLYFWPPDAPAAAEASVSLLDEPLVRLRDVSHVTLDGLAIECGRGLGAEVDGGVSVTIARCALRNLGTYAVQIAGGFNHAVAGCDIAHTGDGGIRLTGGDRRKLTPCHHRVENCHIHHFSRWSKCYCPAILAHGVGMRFTHNRLHDAPHTAILFTGNDFVIENNEIYAVCMETGDAGAIYTGRDFTFRGNVVRHNFIHHMGGVGMGTMGVYNDDCVSGTAMIGNVFYRVTRGAMLGGGRDFRVENNLFIACEPAIHFDSRGISRHPNWHRMVYTTMKERLEQLQAWRPPYSARYPEIAPIRPFIDDPAQPGVPPEHCAIERNVSIGGTWIHIDDGAKPFYHPRDNLITRRAPPFRDERLLDFRTGPDRRLRRIGFEPIPMDRIGLVDDAVRSSVPPRRLVHVDAAVSRPPSVRPGGAMRPGRIVVTVENRGGMIEAGAVRLLPRLDTPAEIRWVTDSSYRLKPGRSVQLIADAALPAGAAEAVVGVHRADEDFLRRELTLRVGPKG